MREREGGREGGREGVREGGREGGRECNLNPLRTRYNILSDKHINLYGCFILGVNTLYVTCI